ncbi:hypothetical protein BDR07DRAFT_1095192 [Suillus spraguei]|nr:hypothetical protein BDR07DRAFT_1095192 [Suillus spraguei]
MASTSSQTSTSPQHSNTSISDNNNQMMNNIFDTNGSPTLVVAFMVIGLSMATMAVLFAWRKMHRERVMVQPAMRPAWARPGRKPITLGEKPALWNMWTRREEEVTIDLKWESITPFCATLHYPTEEPPRPVSRAVEPLQNPPRSSFAMTCVSASRRYFGSTTRSPLPQPEPEPRAYELDDMSERLGSGVPSLSRIKGLSVVMAFTIAMPSPSRKRDDAASGSEASDRASTPEPLHDTELGEYCIGIESVEVSCSEDR